MFYRFLIACFLLSAGFTGMILAADTSEQFLSAYQAYQQGERAERDGNTGEALKNYHFAESLLQVITSKDPSWQKAVVEYRLKKTRDALSRLGGPDSVSVDPAPTASVPPEPTQDATSPAPSSAGPSITITPPGLSTARPQPSNISSSEVRRLKRLVESLKSELQSAKDASAAEKSRSDDLVKMEWTKEKSKLEQALTEAKDQIASLGDKLRKRDSWEKDLRDLQKKLDDAVADKASSEEYYQQREKKLSDSSAALAKQLQEAREKIAAGDEGGRKVGELTKQVEEQRESLKQLQAKLDHAGEASKEAESKDAALNARIQDLTAKLSKSESQVADLSPLREKIDALQKEVSGLRKDNVSSKQSAKDAARREDSLRADLEALGEDRNRLAAQVDRLAVVAKEASRLKGIEGESGELRKAVSSLRQQIDTAAKEAEHSRIKLARSEEEAKSVSLKMRAVTAAMEADRAVLDEEQRQLRAKLAVATQRIDGLGSQLQVLEPSKKEAEELKAKLAENEKALQEIHGKLADTQKRTAEEKSHDLDKINGLQETVTAANQEKKAGEADRAALEEERRKLEAKFAEATQRISDLSGRVETLETTKKDAEGLRARLEESTKSLKAADDKIAQLQSESSVGKVEAERKLADIESLRKSLEAQNAALQQQLKDALAQIGSRIDKKPETAALQDQLTRLQQQLAENSRNYAESQRKLAEMASSRPEQEKLLKQREQDLAAAREESKKLKGDLENSNRKIAELQQQSQEGQDRMKQLQDKLAELSLKASSGDKAEGVLQKEVDRLKAEAEASRQKIASMQGNSDKVGELREQLAEKEAQLARLKRKRGSRAVADAKDSEENTVLRGIILRQVKEEAKRAQARRFMEEEMKRLNVKSQTLSEQIGVLSAPVLVLSPEERALFKEGQLVVLEDGGGALQASVAAPLPVQAAPSATNGLTPGDSAPPGVSGQPTNKAKASEEAPKELAWQGKFKECLSKAKEEFDRQDFLQAENSFKEALGYSPEDYFTLANLGVVEFQLGKLKEAEEFLMKASQKKSDNSFALTTLGIVDYRQGRLEDAEKTLRKAIAVNEQDFTAHNYLGIVLAASGKAKAGESEIMKAIEINGNYADAHFNLAVIYATGKPPSRMMAKKHYMKAMELGAPPDPSLERLVQ